MKLKARFNEIARRNDLARRRDCDIKITQKASELLNVPGMLYKVRAYNNFNDKIDPYGWHDMGRFFWYDQEVVWQFDYMDKDLKYFVDPMDEDCRRVINVMLACEY